MELGEGRNGGGTDFKIYHGGQFVTKKNITEYVGGKLYLRMDVDEVCYFNLVDIVMNELKYETLGTMWFRRHEVSLFRGRVQVKDDKDIENLLASKDKSGFIKLYMVHAENGATNHTSPPITSPSPLHPTSHTQALSTSNNQAQPTPNFEIQPTSSPQPTSKSSIQPTLYTNPTSFRHKLPFKKPTCTSITTSKPATPTSQTVFTPIATPTSQTTTTTTLTLEKATSTTTPTPQKATTTKTTKSGNKQKRGSEANIFNLCEEEDWDDDETNDSDVILSDGDFDDEGDDDLFSQHVDEGIVDRVERSLTFNNLNCPVDESDDENYVFRIEEDEVLDSGDEGDIRSTYESDEDETHYPTFNPQTDFERPINLSVGLQFPSVEVFRKALRYHSIQEGYDYYQLHNGKSRVTAYCKQRCACLWVKKFAKFPKCTCTDNLKKCNYKVHAKKVKLEETFQVKSLRLKHNCNWPDFNTKVSSKYLAERYIDEFRLDPEWKIKVFQRKVFLDLKVEIGYHKAYYAKMEALKEIYGTAGDQYKKVWDYASTIVKYNPGSSAIVVVGDIEKPPPVFERFYVCFEAVKEGFLAGCRPILGVDGCHLKGVHEGQLLTAVGKDGNSNIYPVAWAIVEVENIETWSWFLDLLVKDLGSIADKVTYISEKEDITFMSDRQKGLLEAFQIVVPNAEIRFCARHIWANFKLRFPGEAYKQSFWKAARAYTKVEFNKAMEGIKFLSKEAHTYLDNIPTKNWSRHAFTTNPKSSMLLNNCCESFNNVLRPARDKPVLTLLEWVRRYVMKRMCSKREGAFKFEGKLMPTAMKQLEIASKEYKNTYVMQSGLDTFEVDDRDDTYVVDLKAKTCSCFKWDLTGIPCTHAFHCIIKKRLDPQDFVHIAYTKETYLRAYTPALNPLPGIKQWETTSLAQPNPPVYRKRPGRPTKKNRRKEPGEDDERATVKRKRKQNSCSNCGKLGHNKQRCNNPPAPKKQKKKKKGGSIGPSAMQSAQDHAPDHEQVNSFDEINATSSQPLMSQQGT